MLLVLLQATEENKEKDAAADRAKNMICAGMDALNDDLYLETLVRDSLFDHGLVCLPKVAKVGRQRSWQKSVGPRWVALAKKYLKKFKK